MHAIAFETKRAFHGFLRITRKPFASLGLTAARYDLMTLVLVDKWAEEMSPPRQSELWRALGVTPGVVSRMLRGLEDRGMVTRERPHKGRDRRQRFVRLTALGKACLFKLRRWMQRGLPRVVLQLICFGKHHDPNERLEHMQALESYLTVLRKDFGDRSSLYYPWGHPDD